MARDMETLDLVSRLADGHRGFELLKKEALKKVEKNEVMIGLSADDVAKRNLEAARQLERRKELL